MGASVTIGGGDVAVNAQNFSAVTTSAVPASGDPDPSNSAGRSAGLGAALALSLISDTTEAEVQDNAPS